MPKELIVLILSMFPFTELRLTIPLAISKYQMSGLEAFTWSLIGNIIPVILIVFMLESISSFLSQRSRLFKKFFDWLFERTRRKHSKKFEVFKDMALVIFVAIPLPVTGGWSGALAAFVFGVPPKNSIPLITLGLIIAGIIVTLVSLGIISFL